MLFIDWISTPDHRNFNRSFFAAISLNDAECVVFSEALLVPEVQCTFEVMAKRRFVQAFKVLRHVWKNRKIPVILLTYDQLFLPIASLLNPNLIVFEHNTTPETRFSFRLLWQRVFFGRIYRMAQYPSQYQRLRQITNNAFYIGSPLSSFKRNGPVKSHNQFSNIFIAPSYRANIDSLGKFSDLLVGSKVLCKKISRSNSTDFNYDGKFSIQYVDWVEFHHESQAVDATIVTVKSRVRGTGWFNDSIFNDTPIVILHESTKRLFEETFPGFPFIYLSSVKSRTEFKHCLCKIRNFNSDLYVKTHNANIKSRFLKMCAKANYIVKY